MSMADTSRSESTPDGGLGELARRVATAGTHRDEQAEEALCRELAHRVRLYGLRHLRSRDRADDLVQEVLVTTLERLRSGEVRDPAAIISFVLGTCRRLVADVRRGERRRSELLERYLPREEPAANPDTFLDRDRLEHCLAALFERERSVLQLTFIAELDPDEIACTLQVSTGNVRVIRHRALARMRDCLWGAA